MAQTSYLVTPTWVEVGLDCIELKLGWMLGWVVTLMTEYAQDLLDCYARCQAKYAEVDNGFADLKALKTETWDEDDDEGLEEFLTWLDTESDACYQKVNEVQHSNIEIFEKCLALTAPVKPPTTKQTHAAPSITPMGFKPQADLKPTFLIKDCTLTEFNKFTETF